jgi:hypothetical protein
MASRAMLVDQALAEYGSEAQPVRNLVKQALDQSHNLFWRGADVDPAQLKAEVAFKRWGQVASALDALDPKTPAPRPLQMRRPVSACAAKSLIGRQNEVVRQIIAVFEAVARDQEGHGILVAIVARAPDRAGRIQHMLRPNRGK